MIREENMTIVSYDLKTFEATDSPPRKRSRKFPARNESAISRQYKSASNLLSLLALLLLFPEKEAEGVSKTRARPVRYDWKSASGGGEDGRG